MDRDFARGGAEVDKGGGLPSAGDFRIDGALGWDEQMQNLLGDVDLSLYLAAGPASPASISSLPASGDSLRADSGTRAARGRPRSPNNTRGQASSGRGPISDEVRATRAAWQRGYRERLKERGAQLPAELEATQRAVAALRAENAALEERVVALSLVDTYTEEMASVAVAAAAEQQARPAPAGAPSAGGRLSLLAGAVFRAMPPSACTWMTNKAPSPAQIRFFAEHATVDQFRAINDIRATWVNQLAQQCVDGDQGAETQLEGFFEVQKIIIHTVMQHRVDVLDEMAKIKLPGASVPHSLSAATTDGSGSNPLSAGINPLLLPLHHQISLTPCQRAQLVPHWRSFLSESRVLRQEMRAALVRVSTAPEALIATYQGAQASAETLLSATEAAAALREMYCTHLRMIARLVLALFTLLSTKQTAFLLLATQHHTLDPEQICKVLLGGGGDDGEGLPGGGDRGHVLAELATSSA